MGGREQPLGRDLTEFWSMVRDLPTLVDGLPLFSTWTPEGDAAWLTGPAAEVRGWRLRATTGVKEELFDVTRTRKAIAAALGSEPAGRGLPFLSFGFCADTTVSVIIGGRQLLLDLDGYQVTEAPVDPMGDLVGTSQTARTTPQVFERVHGMLNPQSAVEVPSPDGEHFLSIAAGNLYLRSTRDGRRRALTRDGTEAVEWRIDVTDAGLVSLGLAVPVTNWSPDGYRVAAYLVDNRAVFEVPQVHYLSLHEQVEYRYSPKAGGAIEHLQPYVVDVHGQAQPIQVDTADSYPVFCGWLSPTSVLLCIVARDLRSVAVHVADVLTGRTRQVLSETADTFLRIHHDIYFGRKAGLTLVPGRTEFLWESTRTGFKHLFVVDAVTGAQRQLTDGDWPVVDVTAVTAEQVLFTAHHDQARPYDTQLCRVPLAGGPVERLTPETGEHSVELSADRTLFRDTHSAPDRPPSVVVRRVDGRPVGHIATADLDRYWATGASGPEQFTVLAADGTTDLWGILFKPKGFDAERRYPVIEYIYGGPQLPATPHRFTAPDAGFARYAQALAQLGYVTVLLDARGTPGRSKAFHDAVYRRWANCLADDHAGALLQLAARFPWLDAGRIGVVGHSWGGYSAVRCVLDRPDVFAAAVASAPGFDPWASTLYECYLDLPQRNPEGYRFADLVNKADRLTRPLMIAGGTSDHGTWADALKMSEALIRAGRSHDFVVLPGQYHGFDAVHEEYFWTRSIRFFDEHLQAGQLQENA